MGSARKGLSCGCGAVGVPLGQRDECGGKTVLVNIAGSKYITQGTDRMHCKKAIIEDAMRNGIHDHAVARAVHGIPPFLLCGFILAWSGIPSVHDPWDDVACLYSRAGYHARTSPSTPRCVITGDNTCATIQLLDVDLELWDSWHLPPRCRVMLGQGGRAGSIARGVNTPRLSQASGR